MSEVVKVREKSSVKQELKLAFVLVPLIALLGGVGIGTAFAIQTVTISIPWLPVLAIIPILSFAYLMKHYFNMIDSV